jgi:glycosyltransferase involved in cell wall biosynthesis
VQPDAKLERSPPRRPVTARPTLSIVIPAYNEAARLPDTLARLDAYFAGREPEIVVVDDGSSDGTAELARRGVPGRTPPTVLAFPENRGKGAAVRAGVAASSGDAVLYMDADLATDIAGLDEFLKQLEDFDVVVGSRAVPGATVHNTTQLRTVMGRTFNRMVRMLTRLEVHDSQCGYKAFRGDAGRLVFSLSTVDGFAFDPEVLMIARALGLSVTELPVDWTAVEGSTVRPLRDSVLTGVALLRVVWQVRGRRVRARALAVGWTPAASAEQP